MIDLHAHYGNERKWVGYDDLMDVMKKDNVVVEEGDLGGFPSDLSCQTTNAEVDTGSNPQSASTRVSPK